MIKLSEERDLEYCHTQQLGGKPLCRPDIKCKLFETNELWLIQCELPNAKIIGKNYKNEIALRITNGNILTIMGTIFPTYQNYNNINIIFEDSITHGFFARKFEIPSHVVGQKAKLTKKCSK